MRHLRRVSVIALVVMLLALGGTLTAVGAPPRQDDALPPQVYDTAPLPGEELLLDGPVTFYFDQAMNPTAAEAAFSVDPAIDGALSWTDEFTLVFTPSAAYERATEYTFTIAASAEFGCRGGDGGCVYPQTAHHRLSRSVRSAAFAQIRKRSILTA